MPQNLSELAGAVLSHTQEQNPFPNYDFHAIEHLHASLQLIGAMTALAAENHSTATNLGISPTTICNVTESMIGTLHNLGLSSSASIDVAYDMQADMTDKVAGKLRELPHTQPELDTVANVMTQIQEAMRIQRSIRGAGF